MPITPPKFTLWYQNSWSSLLTAWFSTRLSPHGVPTAHLSWDYVPLWHNVFLPGLESLYDHFSRAQQDQALSLAYLEQQKQFRQEQAFQLHLHKAERTSKFHFQSPIPIPFRKTVFKSLETTDGNLVTDQTNMANTLVALRTRLNHFPNR